MTGNRATKKTSRDPRPVAVDLFAGAGGMSLGFEQAGFDVLTAVDNDPVHLAVHERNFPYSRPMCADVSTVLPEEIHGAVRKGWALSGRDGEWDGTIDCLFGGPTCQGFSDMGRQAADDERNGLVLAFARLVEDLQPRSFVIENVPGLLFPKFRDHLDLLLKRLRNAGYTLQGEWPQCYDAADYGVPQRRRRVFLVGVSEGLPMPPSPTAKVGPTVAEALDDLPNVDDFEDLQTSTRLVLTPEQEASIERTASLYVKSLRRRSGLEYRRIWDESILSGCQRTDHSPSVRSRFEALAPGDEDAISRTSRLLGRGRSQTLRAGTGRDHGSFTAPRPIHHRHARVITVREAARLHSFPDWFAFNVAKWHALREIGNSVPPRLAAAVAETIVAAFDLDLPTTTIAYPLGSDELLEFSLHGAADYFSVDRRSLPADVRRRSSSKPKGL
jgi:DNA (cytosine-5)-methyltransferase 1